jgi:tetratricopeptide (TPR) repeat protein
MREAMAELARGAERFRDALGATNDSQLRDFFGGLLQRLELILKNESAGITAELATDLDKMHTDLRRLRLPDQDPKLGDTPFAFTVLRTARGDLSECLLNALDAARLLGMERRLPNEPPLFIAETLLREHTLRLDKRLRALEDAARDLERAITNAGHDCSRSSSQNGLLNFHIGALKVEANAARFELSAEGREEDKAAIDLASLARVAEAIRDIGRDLRDALVHLSDRLDQAVRMAGTTVAYAANRIWLGTRALVRNVLRRTTLSGVSRPASAKVPVPADSRAHQTVHGTFSTWGPVETFHLAEMSYNDSNISRAEILYREALAKFRASRWRLGEANCVRRLSDLASEHGNFDRAKIGYEEALNIYRDEGSIFGAGLTLGALTKIAAAEGDTLAARDYIRAAIRLDQRIAKDIVNDSIKIFRRRGLAREVRWAEALKKRFGF